MTENDDVMVDSAVKKPKSAEMHAGPGFRIRSEVERVDPSIVDGFAPFETPAVSDLMNRLYTMAWEIQCLTGPEQRLIGPACTVKVYPGDNLMVHKALDIAKPGDVIVVDASSSTAFAVLGDLVSTKAHHRGIQGFVVDGLVRDLPGILRLQDFPVFARGATPIGPLHRGPGEINYPVSVGGIVVNPGDLVMADRNGVVVVPRDYAGVLLQRLNAQAAAEADYVAAVAAGRFSNVWVDEALAEAGVLHVDGPLSGK
jgi:RraA family protein